MASKLDTRWTQHLQGATEQEKTDYEVSIRSSNTVFRRLEQLLLQDLEALTMVESNEETYKTSDWSHLQAHRNGIRSYIRKMLSLIPKT